MTTSIPLSELESSPSAKFVNIGDSHVGRITAINERQQTDINGKALAFPDGSPRMQWIISIEKEGGEVVALYAKGGKFKAASGSGESMLSAIGSAVRAAEASSVDVGGKLAVAYTGNSEAKPGQSPAKLYTAKYEPPTAASVPVEDLFSGSEVR
jgi:hypothetical protein